MHKVTGDVTAEAEIGRLAEREKAEGAHQQVCAHREDGKAHHLHHHDGIKNKWCDNDHHDHEDKADALCAGKTKHLGDLPKQAGRACQQHDCHDDEDHDGRARRVEDIGKAFDDAERETGKDGTADGAHAADNHHREDRVDQLRPHIRVDRIERCGQDAGECREGDAAGEGECDQARHVDAERLHEAGVFGCCAEQGAEPGFFDQQPCAAADDDGGENDEAAINRQIHESEIEHAMRAAAGAS